MFSSKARNQRAPQAHNVLTSSTPTSGKRMEERQLQRPTRLTQIPKSWLGGFVSEISGQILQPRHSWHHPGRLQRGLSTSTGGQELSIPGLGCTLGQEAGPHLEWTIVDEAMRRGLKMRCVHYSAAMKEYTSASSDHKLIISKESWLLGGAAVWVHSFPVARPHGPLWGLFGFLR